MSVATLDGIPEAFWRDPVERAKTDPAAFGELYDRHLERIYRFVRARIHDDCDAEDVTAEVFVNALRHLGSYRDQGRPFSCWLYRIAVNAVASHYRSRRSHLSLDDELGLQADGEDPMDMVVARERLRAVWRAVDRLPAQQRAAMILKFADDMTMEEVGAVLGKSPAAAKLLIYRAVQRLREQLRPEATCPTPPGEDAASCPPPPGEGQGGGRKPSALRNSDTHVMQPSARAAR